MLRHCLLLAAWCLAAQRSEGKTTTRCSPDDIEAAVEAVRQHTFARRNKHVKHVYHTLTRAQLYAIHPCVTTRSDLVTPRDFALAVMASSKHRKRLVNQQQSWGARASQLGVTIAYISDKADEEGLSVTLLDDPHTRDPSYEGAQHRSLRGLQHILQLAPHARWFWMVDDDCFYDVEEAASVVRFINPAIPVIVGYVYRGHVRFSAEMRSTISGGAGMLLSRAAAQQIGAAIYTPQCPFTGLNDITISRCAYNLNIPMVRDERRTTALLTIDGTGRAYDGL